MLQKEQSLIEDSTPSIRQLNYAMGYYCFDGQPCNPRFKGFGKQVRSTALQFRWYLENINEYTYQPGKRSCIDDSTPDLPCTSKGTEIKPENNITAALYVYTPHIHGNRLFATIWDRYGFGGTTPSVDVFGGIFPESSLVQAKDGEDTETIYLIHDGQKMAFASMTALITRYDPARILHISSEEVAKYEDGPIIQYPNYSVLETPNGNKYLIDGLNKRLIASDEAFRLLGYNPAELTEVSTADLATITNGSELNEDNPSPMEGLLKDVSSGGVYYVKDDAKYPIVDPILLENYDSLQIVEADADTLAQYRNMPALRIKDGVLVKMPDDPRVYVISQSKRRAIPDEETFLGLGYQWSNIVEISERVIKLHPIGQPLSL